MVRLLKLPEEVRSRYDLSSLQCVIHAAAPCPPEVKRACIEWSARSSTSTTRAARASASAPSARRSGSPTPGRSGKSLLGAIHIVDDDGNELARRRGGPGVVRDAVARSSTTATPRRPRPRSTTSGWGTLGDVGWVDEDGYLYLTDRVSNMIISGGVNIYPREIEDVLVVHPDVADVAVIGMPDADMGESVRAVVQPAGPVDDEDGSRPSSWGTAGPTSAGSSCPTTVALVGTLPRLQTGKISKRLFADWLRQPYPDGVVVETDLAGG